MKRLGILAAVLAIAASCSVNETEPEFVKAPNMFGLTEGEQATKTAITVDGEGVGTILWKPADNINVFFGTTSVRYYSTNEVDATTVVFETSAMLGSTESASDNKWGLYPYDASAICDGSSVTTTIPADQQCVPETFGNNLFPMIAHTSTNELHFKNVCGGIKFSLSRDDIQSITFRGNNNEDIVGQVQLTFDGEDNPVASVVAGEKTITLTPSTGTTFVSGTNYYLVMLPTVLSGGFTMTFDADTEIGTFEYTAKSIEIKRSIFAKKADIDTYAVFVEKIIGPVQNMHNGHEYVDLGLPSGLKWATCNVGATAPEGYGLYFAWGETIGYGQDASDGHMFNWANYKWCNGSSSTITKYCTSSSYGAVDNKTVLDPEDDAASVNWGGSWRMPTEAEADELYTNCTWTWITQNGVNGRLVTGPNGNSIFLPAAGCRYGGMINTGGTTGNFWYSSLYTDSPNNACGLSFQSGYVSTTSGGYRYFGQSVRPVFLKIPDDSTPILQKPSVSFDAWADPNVPMVIAHMTITDNGGSSVTSYGIEHVSDESGNHVVNTYYGSNGTDCYANVSVMGATDITLYFRAFATNQMGTTYSSIKRIRYPANN